jgi:glycosyltransferase involved in cell wall biosynthesis
MRVSILIPCHNAEKWVGATIQSALDQTYKKAEVIVVDDGSTDNSYSIAKAFESQNVKVVRQEQSGPGAARNRAFELSSGEYIQYLDADDVLDRFKVERQMRRLMNGTETVACAKWAKFSDDLSKPRFVDDPIKSDMAPLEWLWCLVQKRYMMPYHGWLTPRSIIEAAGPWNPRLRLHDDAEFFCRVVLKAKTITYVPDAIVYYRVANAQSVSNSKGRQALESAFNVAMSIADHVLAVLDGPIARKIAADRLALFLYAANGQNPDLERQAAARFRALGERFTPVGGPVLRSLVRGIGTLNALKLRRWVWR